MTQAPVREASTSSSTSGLRRVVTASMAGTVVEWYEFFLYASAATLVFGTAFFPPFDDPYAGIIAASSPMRSGSSRGRSAASCSGTSAIGSDASRC